MTYSSVYLPHLVRSWQLTYYILSFTRLHKKLIKLTWGKTFFLQASYSSGVNIVPPSSSPTILWSVIKIKNTFSHLLMYRLHGASPKFAQTNHQKWVMWQYHVSNLYFTGPFPDSQFTPGLPQNTCQYFSLPCWRNEQMTNGSTGKQILRLQNKPSTLFIHSFLAI